MGQDMRICVAEGSTPRTTALRSLGKRTSPGKCDNGYDIDSSHQKAMESLSLSSSNVASHNSNASHLRYTNRNLSQTNAPPSLGVFGVDAHKRINMWNDAAAAVTGVATSVSSRPILGTAFESLFPSSTFPLATNTSLNEVLDDVLERGEPRMGLSVSPGPSVIGRKRSRNGMTTKGLPSDASLLFSLDLLPQFEATGKCQKRVTGVIMVCTKHHDGRLAPNKITYPHRVSLENSTPESCSFSANSIRDDDEKSIISAKLPAPPLYTKKALGDSNSLFLDDEESSHSVFETMDAVVFGVDLNGFINEWNHEVRKVTGILKHEVLGRSLYEPKVLSSFAPSSPTLSFRQDIEPLLSDAFQGQSISRFHLSVHSPTNKQEVKHFLASISPRYDAQEEIIGAIVVALDTTDFCQVKARANQLRKLIDTANAPIFGIDTKGIINEWNDAVANITGFCKEDALGCPLIETFVSTSFCDSIQSVLKNALHHGEGTSNYEVEFRTISNKIRDLLVNVTPQYDANNAIVGAILIAQDVTEAVKRDRAVANMALELRQLIDTANAPIFGIDVHGNVNEWNTRMAAITGFSKEEALHSPLVTNFIVNSMQEKVRGILEAALAGIATSNYELHVLSKSGERICLLVNATTRRDSETNVIGVVGVAQDVTEDRKNAKVLREMQTLRLTQEAKVETERNMTAYFAHELRNPLGAIDSALAAMPEGLPENVQSLVSGMKLCAKFMASIMNNLLDFRKMEEGEMQLGQAPVSIRSIMHNVHKMLSPSVRPGVDFRKLINVKGKNWVLGDAHRLDQVLTNVVSNAIKYTVSGHIQISMEWEGKNLKFICEDTGPGIPKSEQSKLFQQFVQRCGAPGTGLGLAIAKHIVELTGGSIRFESDPTVRAGSTCTVLMPLSVCKAPEKVTGEKEEPIQEPISVLVIDDIKMNRTMMKRRIKKAIAPNAIIKEAATGEEALMICGKEKFDVMVVDQFMEEAGGVMVGTDVVFTMRRMRIDSIVIGCSGNDIGNQFIDAGADIVWQKPMPSNDQIIHALRASLEKRKNRNS